MLLLLLLDSSLVDPLPDIPKEVTGQDNHEGDLEELRDEEEAEADDLKTGHPETVIAQGEESVVDNPKKLDFAKLSFNFNFNLVES